MVVVPSRRWFTGAVALAGVAPLAVVWPAAAEWYLAADVLWVAALVLDAIRAVSIPEIAVTRDPPAAFSVGHALPVWYRWTNRERRRLRLLVREALPASLLVGPAPVRTLTLPAEGSVRERLDVVPHARGRTAGGRFWLRALAPWGLAWRQWRFELPWTVTVFPRLLGASLRSLPAQAMRRREAGQRNVRRLGEGRLFESLREWVPGDETRIIDWKASARRGKLMARQYEDERRQQVLLVVDAGRLLTAEVEGRARLEAVVEAALRLAHTVVEHDDDVGLMVFADQVQRYTPPSRGRRALRLVLEGLATVEGRLVESDYPAAFAYLAARNRKRSLTVLFTDLIDRTASDALVAQTGTLRPRHLPLAVVVRDPALDRLASTRPATAVAAFERAAAEELLAAREEGLAAMRARGVLVLDVPPAGAAEAVIEQYTRLKRRGVL